MYKKEGRIILSSNTFKLIVYGNWVKIKREDKK